MMETKGILLYIWGKPEYGFMAYQLAMSIKYHSPSILIYLITDDVAVSRIRNFSMFDTIEYTATPSDPAQAKIDMYGKLPYDHTIFLDADGLCVAEMDSTFNNLIEADKPFQCFVHAYYNKHDEPIMPLMVWANRDVIWNHYGLDDHTLPASQSSMLYIRKCDVCADIYHKMQQNYINRIPLEKLRNKWGGGQPDELYLNVTLAQLSYDPQCANIIYFADNTTLRPHQIKDKYKILSLFGTAGNVKPLFERFYDGEVDAISRAMGMPITYKWKNIKNSKHANTQRVITKRSAMQGKFIRSEKIQHNTEVIKRGRTFLFTSYFDSGDDARQRELNRCLTNNMMNSNIDHIYVYSESDQIMRHDKLTVRLQGRPTYQDLINWANDISLPDDIIIISNSDIHFDETLKWTHIVNMDMTMIALSRWDILPNGTKRLFAYEHSQDSWIMKGKILIKNADYFMGLPGCDNRIAFDANLYGYRVVNTAKDIITHHIHNTNVRSYTQADRLEGGYMPVFITSVRDIKTNKLLLIQPGKVGDIINCLPIAKHYADVGYMVEWECPQDYHDLFLYVDYVKPIICRSGDYGKVIDISFGLNSQSPTNIEWQKRRKHGTTDSFASLKYEMAGVEISKIRNLIYKRNEINEHTLYSGIHDNYGADYIIVHESSDYGTPINVVSDFPIVYFEKIQGISIFDWRKAIENAKEIHCIDSSLCNFVDAIETDATLYYYPTDRVPMKADRTLLTKKWNTVNVEMA